MVKNVRLFPQQYRSLIGQTEVDMLGMESSGYKAGDIVRFFEYYGMHGEWGDEYGTHREARYSLTRIEPAEKDKNGQPQVRLFLKRETIYKGN